MSRRVVYLLSFSLILAAFGQSGAARALAANLVVNGDFEKGSLQGWSVYNPGGGKQNWAVTNAPGQAHGGSWAATLSQFEQPASAMLAFYNGGSVAGLAPGTLIRARIWLRTEGVSFQNPNAGFSPVLIAWDKAGQVLTYGYATASIAGTHGWTPIDVLLNLPAGATRVDLQLVFGSGLKTGTITVDDFTLETPESPGALATDAPLAEVRRDGGGTPRLHLQGQPVAPIFFFGNHGNPAVFDEIQKAGQAGVNLIQTPLSLPWEGLSNGMLELALQASPNALFMPRIFLQPPATWNKVHPGELIRNDRGELSPGMEGPSLASDLFIADCKAQLETLIRYFHNSPYKDRIIGYHLCYLSGGEWFYPNIATEYVDYSEVNRQRFSRWCAERYQGDLGRLNTAWRATLTSFSQVQVPPPALWARGDHGIFRDPALARPVTDYQEYHNQLVADRVIELGAWVKSLTTNRSLVAAFFGYQSELIGNGYLQGIGDCGHLGWRRLLDSPAVDILCSPVSYFDRGPGQPMNFISLVDSITAGGKLCLQEDDSRTWLWGSSAEPSLLYPTEGITLSCLRRNFGGVVGHNLALWWMDLNANGNFNTASIWQTNRLALETAKDSVARALPACPQIALIYDDDTFYWLKADCYAFTYANVFRQRSIFQNCGAQVGYYHLRDLPRIPAGVKLFVFVNTLRLDAEEEALVNAIKGGGRTLVWLYAPGYITPDGLSLARMNALTGFTLTPSDPPINTQIDITSNVATLGTVLPGLAGHGFGITSPIGPTFSGVENTSGTVVLGRYSANGRPALLLHQEADWNSIFCGSAWLDTPVLRALARFAGVATLSDPDILFAEDAVQYNGRYLYAYGRGLAGTRAYRLPGELVPNGGFEKFAGALPATGYGRWISPVYGKLPACTVTESLAQAGRRAAQTGPFTSPGRQYSVPLGIGLTAAPGDYEVTGWINVDGLDASAAASDEYVYVTVSPSNWTGDSRAYVIAQGKSAPLADRAWSRFRLAYHHTAGPSELDLQLRVYGAYSVKNILLDEVSVREVGARPVTVTELVSGRRVAEHTLAWTDDLTSGEQKIYRLDPETQTAAMGWPAYDAAASF